MTREQITVPPNGMLDLETARVIFDHLMEQPATGRLVEVGTGFGHSTKFFSQALPGWAIYTIDAFGLHGDGRVWSAFAADNIQKAMRHYRDCVNVVQILGDSRHVPWELPVDVAYIDAGHTLESCLRDYAVYGTHVRPGGLIIFDDYYQPNNPTNGVAQVVEQVCKLSHHQLVFTGLAAIVKVLPA